MRSLKSVKWKYFGLRARVLSVVCLIALCAAACDEEATENKGGGSLDMGVDSGDNDTGAPPDSNETTRPDSPTEDTSGGDTQIEDTSGGDTPGGDTSGGDTSGGDTSGGDTSGGDTSGGGVCGDGVLGANEACDTDDLADETCVTLAFLEGDLSCATDCTFDTSACVGDGPACGDNVAEGLETCDGFDTPTCVELGFDSGDAACNADCTLDDSACETCGDGDITGGELCDGADLNGTDCVDLGFDAGELACNPATCTFDMSGCTTIIPIVCGNSLREPGEACDTVIEPGTTCATLGFDGGSVTCNSMCAFNTSACFDTHDRCDDAIPLAVGDSITGSTLVGSDDYSGYMGCPGALGLNIGLGVRDIVYVITLAPGQIFSATLTSASPDVVMALVTDCDALDTNACLRFGPTINEYANATSNTQTVFLIIDGYSGAQDGDFSLDTTLRVIACGDGILDPGEACDDSNPTAGDGCSDTCQIEIPANDTCDTPTPLNAGVNGPFLQYTAGSDYADFSACPGSASASAPGPDTVYSVAIPPHSVLNLTMDVPPTAPGPSSNPVLVLTTSCDAPSAATCLDAADDSSAEGIDETATFSNTTSAPFNVLVIADNVDTQVGSLRFNVDFCTEDPFEPNDTLATAAPITLPATDPLFLCGAHVAPDNTGAELDFYSFNLNVGDRLTATMSLIDSAGNLDLTLISPSGVDIAASWTAGATETFFYTVPAGAAGNYKLRVEPWAPVDADARNTYTPSFTVTPGSALPSVISGCSAPLCAAGVAGEGPNGGTVFTFTIPSAMYPTANSIGAGLSSTNHVHGALRAPNRFCTASPGTSVDLIATLPTAGFSRFTATTCVGSQLGQDSIMAAFDAHPLFGGRTTLDGGALCNDDRPGRNCAEILPTAIPTTSSGELFLAITGFNTTSFWAGGSRSFTVELIP